MENSRILTIKPNSFSFEGEGYNYTKVLGLKCYAGGRPKIVREQPTTWASLARIVLDTYRDEIDEQVERNESAFEEKFNNALKEMLNRHGFRPNTSFSEKLFSSPTHIRSQVYKNNQNSMLKVYDVPESSMKMYITAVYSGEVVWVLNALATALEEYSVYIEIEYIHRDELKRQLGELEEADRQLSLEDIELYQTTEDKKADNDITELNGNAEIYLSLLKVKILNLYKNDRLSKEELNDIMIYIDRISDLISDSKSVLFTLKTLTKDLDKKLGI